MSKGIGTESIEDTVKMEKSPFIRGLLHGARGALAGGAAGAAIQGIRGKNPAMGAILGAIGAGLLTGSLSATKQELSNQEKDAELRYHAERIKTREPYFFLPGRKYMSPLLKNLQTDAHSSEDVSSRYAPSSANRSPEYSG